MPRGVYGKGARRAVQAKSCEYDAGECDLIPLADIRIYRRSKVAVRRILDRLDREQGGGLLIRISSVYYVNVARMREVLPSFGNVSAIDRIESELASLRAAIFGAGAADKLSQMASDIALLIDSVNVLKNRMNRLEGRTSRTRDAVETLLNSGNKVQSK